MALGALSLLVDPASPGNYVGRERRRRRHLDGRSRPVRGESPGKGLEVGDHSPALIVAEVSLGDHRGAPNPVDERRFKVFISGEGADGVERNLKLPARKSLGFTVR